MKVFQAIHSYAPYIRNFEDRYQIDKEHISFYELRSKLIEDRFYAAHLLQPVLDENNPDGFYTMWDYPLLQYKWAEERGWNERSLKKILFAQIEDFQPDVFYNGSPMHFTKEEIQESIDNKIIRVCWSASPHYSDDQFRNYHLRLTNLPTHVKDESAADYKSELFHPAHDPVMDKYSGSTERPVDLFFYGQYLDFYFKKRNNLIDQLLKLKEKSSLNIQIALLYDLKYNNLSLLEKIIGKRKKVIFPPDFVINNSIAPVYGLELYEKIASSKIVFNAAVDFTGKYKVNMRNFETLGLGAHLLSDKGIYPAHMEDGIHFTTYTSFPDFSQKLKMLIDNSMKRTEIARKGNAMIKEHYSKQKQWKKFYELVSSI